MRIRRERELDPLFGSIILRDEDVLRLSKAERSTLERARALLEHLRECVEARYGLDEGYELVEHAVIAEARLDELLDETRNGLRLVRHERNK